MSLASNSNKSLKLDDKNKKWNKVTFNYQKVIEKSIEAEADQNEAVPETKAANRLTMPSSEPECGTAASV